MDKKTILETDISHHHLLNPGGRNGGKDSITTNPIYSEAEELKTPPLTTINKVEKQKSVFAQFGQTFKQKAKKDGSLDLDSFSNKTNKISSIDNQSYKPYHKSYLQKDACSVDFLESVSYKIPLNDLMKLKQNSVKSIFQPFQAVVFEIMDTDLRKIYGDSKYLLQIWIDKGVKVYEKQLECEPTNLQQFQDKIIFRLSSKENEPQYIHFIQFENETRKVYQWKVKDFAPDNKYEFLGYCGDNQIFLATRDGKFKYANLKLELEKCLTDKVIEMKVENIKSYSFASQEYVLLGFIENPMSKVDKYLICIIEREENQLQFVRLYSWGNELNDQEFINYRDIFPRTQGEVKNDSVKKFRYVIDEAGFLHGAALRQSGHVDLYYNYQLVEQSEEIFEDVDVSPYAVFLKKKLQNDEMSFEVFQIDNLLIVGKERFSFDVIKQIGPFDQEKWDSIGYSIIKSHLKLATSLIVRDASFIISYANIISIYDLRLNKWVQNIKVESSVLAMMKNLDFQSSGGVTIFTEDGLYDLTQDSNYNFVHDQNSMGRFIIEEKIEKAYFSEGIEVFNLKEVKQLKKLIPTQRMDPFSNQIIHAYLHVEKKDGTFQILSMLKEGFRPRSDIELTEFDEMVEYQSVIQNEYELVVYSKDQRKLRFFKSEKNGFDEIVLDNGFHYFVKVINVVQIKSSANKDIVMVFSNTQVTAIDMNLKKCMELVDGNYANVQLIDNYLYSMQNEQHKKQSGLFIQSLNTFWDEETETIDQSKCFKLSRAIGGKSDLLQYFSSQERICLQTSFHQIMILPVMHSNRIQFFGMKRTPCYLAIKRINDYLIALDKEQTLITWKITTGKTKFIKNIGSDLGLSDYEIYEQQYSNYQETDVNHLYVGNTEWTQTNVLLKTKKQVRDQLDKEGIKKYFEGIYKEGINGGRTVLECEDKEYHRFKVIEIISPEEVVEHMNFEHCFYSRKNFQRIYISDDRQTLLEQLQNYEIFIFRRENTPSYNQTKEVNFKFIRRISSRSTELFEFSFFNYLYSPNLMMFFDSNDSGDQFSIRNTLDHSLVVNIPTGILSSKVNNPKHIVKHLLWLSNSRFKVINNDSIEKIFEITEDKKIKSVAYGAVPMLNIEDSLLDEKYHFYMDRLRNVPKEKMLQFTLISKVQKFYSLQNVHQVKEPQDYYDQLISIDYSNGKEFDKRKLYIEFSFTYYHWKLMEALANQRDPITVNHLKNEELKLISLNIFPHGNTVSHYLFDQIQFLKKFYIASLNEEIGERDYIGRVSIPFVKNFNGESPLHRCQTSNNQQAINSILELISVDPVDNHARAIIDIFPKIVEMEVPSLDTYLTNRQLQLSSHKRLNRGKLCIQNWAEKTVVSAELWADEEQMKNALTRLQDENMIENDITVKMIDIPEVYKFDSPISIEMFEMLANVDMSLFSNSTIKAIIDHKWPTVRYYIRLLLFVPFVLYLLAFIVFSNVLDVQLQSNKDYTLAKYVIIGILYYFSGYFLLTEIYQLKNQKKLYFNTIWNIPDLFAPVLVLVVISYHLKEMTMTDYKKPNFLISVHSVASLMMWLKFLYFLRIFRPTSYFIRMLSQVIWEIRTFILVLMIVYLGFGEAFLRLSQNSKEDQQYAFNYADAFVYTVRLSIGDTNTDTFNESAQNVTAWILFVLCLLATNIIMLNLLISLISDTFGSINANHVSANYQERARIISENTYLIPSYRLKKLDEQKTSRYIVMAEEIPQVQSIFVEEGQQEEKDSKQAIKEANKEMEERFMEELKQIKEIIVKIADKK